MLWKAETPVLSQEYLNLFINVVNQHKGITSEPVLSVVNRNVLNHANEIYSHGCNLIIRGMGTY